jgi:hypothetical protein
MDHLRGRAFWLRLVVALLLVSAGFGAGVGLERSRKANAPVPEAPPGPRELLGEWLFVPGSDDKYEAAIFYPNGTFDFRWREGNGRPGELVSLRYRWIDEEHVEVRAEEPKSVTWRIAIYQDTLALIDDEDGHVSRLRRKREP